MIGSRLRRDEGASIVELALVLPLLALLAFAVAEVGLAWTAENRVQSAVSSVARTGASAGQVRDADALILMSVNAALPADDWENLDRVIIYDASASDGQPDPRCIRELGSDANEPSSGSPRCNTYSGEFVRSVASTNNTRLSGTGSPCSSSKHDRFWCPSSARVDTLGGPGGPSWLGVWIRVVYPNPVPFFFDDFTLEKRAVYRLQPDFTG